MRCHPPSALPVLATTQVQFAYAEIQKRAAGPIRGGQDVVVQSQTGSGKTLAFVMPLLARLQYPPALYPEDLKVLPTVLHATSRTSNPCRPNS